MTQTYSPTQMTYLCYFNARIPGTHPEHWTESPDKIRTFWHWCRHIQCPDPHVVLEILEITTLCDWRQSQTKAEEKILIWLGISP